VAVHVGLYNKCGGGEEWLQQAMAQHGGVGELLEAATGAELCQGVFFGQCMQGLLNCLFPEL
jgi:hypothetical protein